ncbi:MAG TPA: DUF6252 family protein [Bacteroidales bacterium]
MKSPLKLICLLFLVTSIASCKKDNTSAPVKMSAVVDSKTWSPDLRVVVLQNDVFTITASSPLSSLTLVITINGSATGTYSFPAISSICGATYTNVAVPSSSDIYASVTGSVVLTKVDKTAKLISGTFEFTMANTSLSTKSITNGQFNDLQYMEY